MRIKIEHEKIKSIYTILTICLVIFFFLACNRNEQEIVASNDITELFSRCDTTSTFYMLSDTIIYDVIIKNPEPYNEWRNYCLRHLKKTSFVDTLFNAVYSEKIKVFDYFTGEEITAEKLKNIESESGFNRDNIGKLQFTEKWVYNASSMEILKKVIAVTVGYEIFIGNEMRPEYNPVFKFYIE